MKSTVKNTVDKTKTNLNHQSFSKNHSIVLEDFVHKNKHEQPMKQSASFQKSCQVVLTDVMKDFHKEHHIKLTETCKVKIFAKV